MFGWGYGWGAREACLVHPVREDVDRHGVAVGPRRTAAHAHVLDKVSAAGLDAGPEQFERLHDGAVGMAAIVDDGIEQARRARENP